MNLIEFEICQFNSKLFRLKFHQLLPPGLNFFKIDPFEMNCNFKIKYSKLCQGMESSLMYQQFRKTTKI